jgi:hypothetical protein
MSSIYNLTDTWNNLGTTFDGVRLDVTDTQSAAGSKLFHALKGGTAMFYVDKNGNGYFAGDILGGSFDLTDITLTGTTAQFNAALSDGDFATRAGTETLTNKTLTSPTINGGTISGITDLTVADGGTGASSAAAARTNLGVAVGTDVQAHGDVLDDLNTLGAATADNQFPVSTGAGVLAWESGATARGSLGIDEDFKTVALLIADNTKLSYAGGGGERIVTAGDIVTAGGFRYEVQASGASGHITNSAGTPVQLNNLAPNISKLICLERRGLTSSDTSAGAANKALLEAAITEAADNYIIEFPTDGDTYEFGTDVGTGSQAAQTVTFTSVPEIRGGHCWLENLRFVSGAAYQKFRDIRQRYANFPGAVNGGNSVAIRHTGVEWSNFRVEAQSANQDGNTGAFDIGRAGSMIYDLVLKDGYFSNGGVDGIDVYGNVRRLRIINITGRCADDGIVLKALDADGPVSDVVIDGCDIEAASLLGIGTQIGHDIYDVHCYGGILRSRGRALYLKHENATHNAGNVYNISMNNTIIHSPATQPADIYTSDEGWVQKIAEITDTAGTGIVRGVSMRNTRLDGVSLNSSDGGGMLFRFAMGAGKTIRDVNIDGVDIFARTVAGAAAGTYASWGDFMQFGGTGAIENLRVGNVSYDGEADEGLSNVFRGRNGGSAGIIVTGPIHVKRCNASSNLIAIETGGSMEIDWRAPVVMPAATTLSVDADYTAGTSTAGKPQKSVTILIPSSSAGVDADYGLLALDRRILLDRVSMTTPTAITQSDTDYITFYVRDGSGAISATTKATGGLNLAADAIVEFKTPNIGRVVPTSQGVRFQIRHSGAGRALAGLALTLWYTELE